MNIYKQSMLFPMLPHIQEPWYVGDILVNFDFFKSCPGPNKISSQEAIWMLIQIFVLAKRAPDYLHTLAEKMCQEMNLPYSFYLFQNINSVSKAMGSQIGKMSIINVILGPPAVCCWMELCPQVNCFAHSTVGLFPDLTFIVQFNLPWNAFLMFTYRQNKYVLFL